MNTDTNVGSVGSIAFGTGSAQQDSATEAKTLHEHARRKHKFRKKHHRQLTNDEQERRRQWAIIARAMPCLFLITGIVLIFSGQAHIDVTQRNWKLTLTGIIMASFSGCIFLVLLLKGWITSAISAITDRRERNEFDEAINKSRHYHHHHHHHHDSLRDDDSEDATDHAHRHKSHHTRTSPSSFKVE